MKNHFEDELPIKHHFYILFERLFRLLLQCTGTGHC